MAGARPDLVFEPTDPLDAAAAEALARSAADVGGTADVRITMARVRTVDTFGVAGLAASVRALRTRGSDVRVVDLDPSVRRRTELLRMSEVLAAAEPTRPRRSSLDALLSRVSGTLDAGLVLLAMLYEGFRHAVVDGASTLLGREQVARQLDQIGARSVSIVAGVTFLIGSIMALQTAYAVEPYGGLPFVGRGVALSMVRELGPLMTALLLAGRSGSAIAAELGSMVVYEEVDALDMMGLAPRRFLLSPRFLALCVAAPALSILANVCGILGGGVVMTLGYGISWTSYYQQAVGGILGRDLASGLIKSLFFGALVAVVACRRGLSLRGGPEAVGRAATAAVVDAILAVIIFDAAFTLSTQKVL
jgi:phospholipid/cholesterol/gamma-HCH transport system permease protein